ncbi:hypothetical protein Tco_0684292 [Tanacetum coccineum]
MFIEFVIQNQLFSYSLEEFAQILDIPCEGACVFTDKWSLDELAYGVPTDGPYQTNPPSPDDIISYIRIDREGQVRRIRHEKEIDVHDHQILTREIVPTLKPLEEIIRENVFCLGATPGEVVVAGEGLELGEGARDDGVRFLYPDLGLGMVGLGVSEIGGDGILVPVEWLVLFSAAWLVCRSWLFGWAVMVWVLLKGGAGGGEVPGVVEVVLGDVVLVGWFARLLDATSLLWPVESVQ